MPSSLSVKRFWFANFIVGCLFLIVIYQLFQLTVLRRDSLLILAEKQHHLTVEIPPLRGQILDRNGKELATSLKVPSIYAVPRLMSKEEKAEIGKKLSDILDLSLDYIESRLDRDKAFIWIKRKATFEQADAIRKLEHPGLGILEEYKRFYPQGDLLAQVLGIVNIDNQGMEGVELYFNRELQGRPGRRYTKRDALGREIKAFEMKTIPALDGNKVYLTIDQYFQYLTERALDRAYTKWNAKGGAAVLMEVKTGRILAMANRPTFDPNHINESTPETRRNRAITDVYEPGSVFKIVPTSAALNEGKSTLETEFFCENGEYNYYRGFVLHDVHPYGNLSFRDILIKSSNIGTVKIAAELDPNVFQDYIKGFGFGKATGVDMPGEVHGFTRPPSQWSKTSPYNIPIGHEILVTLLQMTTAMGVVANDGKLMTPHILSKVEDGAGVIMRESKPSEKAQVISPEVARQIRETLIGVVEEGTGRRAKIDGIPVAGKTGTAQKVLEGGKGYSHDDFMSSFIGFAPADDPKFVMGVVLDDPGPKYYGGTVAAPVFKEVIEAAVLASGYIPHNAELYEPPKKLPELQENPPTLLPTEAAGKGLSPQPVRPGR